VGPHVREQQEEVLAKRANYGYEKRQKEINRQKKREEKAERKRLKKESGGQPDPGEAAQPTDTQVESPGPTGGSSAAARTPEAKTQG
jgi:hypothetical protein